MALKTTFKEISFGIGDQVKVYQTVSGSGKRKRAQVFEGIVIAIKNKGTGKNFTVRRIGAQKIGIEQTFPLHSPVIERVEVVRHGLKGVSRAKLYYIRGESKKKIERIYLRAARRKKETKTKTPNK